MMLDIRISNVDQLALTAKETLYETHVMGIRGEAEKSANGMRETLASAIATMKEYWAGKDAGVQINNVIQVYNALGTIGNGAASLAKLSLQAAQIIRDAQNANGAGFQTIDTIFPVEMTDMPPHTDDRDTVSITSEVQNASTLLSNVVESINVFKTNIGNVKDEIADNWQTGESIGRNQALSSFQDLIDSITKYQEYLNSAVESVNTAFANYSNL